MNLSLLAPVYFESLFWKPFAMFIALRGLLLSQCALVSFELGGALLWRKWACECGGTNWEATLGWCGLCCGETYPGILDGTMERTELVWGDVEMQNWRAGPERLMGGAGKSQATGGTDNSPEIVIFFSSNCEYSCISWRMLCYTDRIRYDRKELASILPM